MRSLNVCLSDAMENVHRRRYSRQGILTRVSSYPPDGKRMYMVDTSWSYLVFVVWISRSCASHVIGSCVVSGCVLHASSSEAVQKPHNQYLVEIALLVKAETLVSWKSWKSMLTSKADYSRLVDKIRLIFGCQDNNSGIFCISEAYILM